MLDNRCSRLHVLSFGLALGITWAIAMFLLGLGVWWFAWGTGFLTSMSSIYIGFKGTLLGSLIGLVWGFVDGFIGGVILAALYNLFLTCCPRREDEPRV